jgi:putative ubiquitin-RnfH superfamily antitoxin RatB of RatAB toxin-antitoxin module
MRVSVACVEPGTETLVSVELPDGATVDDAIRAARIADVLGTHPDSGLAIFGRRATGATVLCDGDRVELTRPLVCDPKAARRRRAGPREPLPDDHSREKTGRRSGK